MSLAMPFQHDDSAWRDLGLWGGAAVVVVAAHLGLAYAVATWSGHAEPAGAPDTAIMVDLAPISTSIDAEQLEEPSEVAAVKTPDVPPEPVEEPELLEPVEPPPLDDWQEPVIDLPEIETPPVEPEVVLPVEKPKPEKPKEKAEKKKPEPKKIVKTRRPPSEVTSRLSATEAPRAQATQASEASRSTVRSVSPATWHSRVAAHLARHKRGGSGRGTVRLTLTVDASGRVISQNASSGNVVLDRAAEDLARRASPVPAPPPELGVTRETFTTRIDFR